MSDALMSEERLREIEERVSKATPGPWRDDVYVFECGVFEEGDYEKGLSRQIPIGKCDDCGRGPLLATIVREGRTYHRHMREGTGDWRCIFSASNGDEICGNYDYEEGGVASTKEDADFISHARQDVPAMQETIRELQARVAELETDAKLGRSVREWPEGAGLQRGVPGMDWIAYWPFKTDEHSMGLRRRTESTPEAALEAARKEENHAE